MAKPEEGKVLGFHRVRVKKTADHLLQVSRYSRGYWSGFEGQGGRKKDGEQGKDVEKNRRDTARRRYQAVIDTANCNFDGEYAKFITLTYAENMQDIDRAAKDLDRWLQRVRRKLGTVHYLWVMEFQKRGAIHYHLLLDYQPVIPWEWLQESWPHGDAGIKAIKHVDNVGAYVAKYMAKLDDRRLDGRRAYGTSRGMKEPEIITGREAENIARYLEERQSPVHVGAYTGEFVGEVQQASYNLKRGAVHASQTGRP